MLMQGLRGARGTSMMYVDLHLHTTASDGVLTPSELVRYAKTKKLQAIAVTDHDTIEGLDEAAAEGESIGFEVIPGIEISAEFSPGSMHLLGYFIDIRHPLLIQKLKSLQEARAARNPKIVERLNRLGVRITYEDVVKASGGGQVGRPHFAQVLLEKGYVRSVQEAFERFLKKGAPAYADKFRFKASEAINFINGANGIAVLAHPNTLGMDGNAGFEALLLELVKGGLRGIEVYYPEHSASDVARYKLIAEKLGLVMTGGTDYHGIDGIDLDIGIGRGDMRLPYSMVEELRAAQAQPR
jgi:predicted metal-dependent phosphoesterase TrpH